MTAKLINGNEIAQQIREELKQETARLKEKNNVVPGLVTILVGENPASVSYVTAKQKTSKELGFYSIQDNQPATIQEEELLKLIDRYNKDPKIHGILVQLPLPKHINETKVLFAIDPKKDVDGFHPVNVGKLMIGEADYLPCTPAGIQQLLIRTGRGRGKVQHRRKTYRQHPATKTERGQCNGDDLPHRFKGYGFPYEEG
jgi:methylenetetrahydrofolate dehydrogenase (NADP+)/methenyltetrahydrofolate cyclohydrolase